MSGEQESGGVPCLMSFLKTGLESRRGKVVGIIPVDVSTSDCDPSPFSDLSDWQH